MSHPNSQYPIPQKANSYICQEIGALHGEMAREGMEYFGVHTLFILDGKITYRFDNEKSEEVRPHVDFTKHADQVQLIKDATTLVVTDKGSVKAPGDVNPGRYHRVTVPQAGGKLKIEILSLLRTSDDQGWSLCYQIQRDGPQRGSLALSGSSKSAAASTSFVNTDTTSVNPDISAASLASGHTEGTGVELRPVNREGTPVIEFGPPSRAYLLFKDSSDGYSMDDW